MQSFETETLRDRLIIAGIDEIYLHGIADFSLRRVASSCNTSCAAPYKHFKNKEELIEAITEYIHSRWKLLENEICDLFETDPRKQTLELCLSFVRFWVAHPNYRFALSHGMNGINGSEDNKGDSWLSRQIEKVQHGEVNSDWRTKAEFRLRALLYGTVMMIESGEADSTKETFDMLREGIVDILLPGSQTV